MGTVSERTKGRNIENWSAEKGHEGYCGGHSETFYKCTMTRR